MPPRPALPVSLPIRRLALLLLLAFAGLLALPAPAAAEDDFLPVKSAFKVAVEAEPGVLVVNFEVAPGYYLYRDRLGFETATPGVTLGQASLPVGLDHADEFFGKQVIYRDVVRVGVPVSFRRRAPGFRRQGEAAGLRRRRPVLPPAELAGARGVARQAWPAARLRPRRSRLQRLPARMVASTCVRSLAAARSRTRTSCRPTRRSCSRPRARPAIASRCAGTSRTIITFIVTSSPSGPPRPTCSSASRRFRAARPSTTNTSASKWCSTTRWSRIVPVAAAAGVHRGAARDHLPGLRRRGPVLSADQEDGHRAARVDAGRRDRGR